MSTAAEIDLSTIVRQRAGLVAHQVDDTLVVSDERGGCCYGLDFTARKIWQFVGCRKSVADLCAMLLVEYDIDRKACECDVLDFLGELKREGLIEIV